MGIMGIRKLSRRGRLGYTNKAREWYLVCRSRARYYKRTGKLRMSFVAFRYLDEMQKSRIAFVDFARPSQ